MAGTNLFAVDTQAGGQNTALVDGNDNAVLMIGNSASVTGGAAIGCLLIDGTVGKLYINTGTVASPTWTVVGTQS